MIAEQISELERSPGFGLSSAYSPPAIVTGLRLDTLMRLLEERKRLLEALRAAFEKLPLPEAEIAQIAIAFAEEPA